MTRAELYDNIFYTILQEHSDIFEHQKDVLDECDLNGAHNAIYIALENDYITNSDFKNLVTRLQQKFNEEEIDCCQQLDFSITNYEKKSNKRNFIWYSKDLSIINCDMFFQMDQIGSDTLLLGIEQICNSQESLGKFLDYLKTDMNKGRNDYCVICNTTKFPNDNKWKLYMYGLSLYLNNGNKLPFDKALEYSPQQTYNTNYSYNDEIQYNQFIDIYDVISEWNTCSDVLTAFLKMYQILEYIVYRKNLVKIVQGGNIKQSFIRQIRGLDKKFTNAERETFINGLQNIFPSFSGKINVPITPDIENFCKNYYSTTKNGNTYLTQGNINDPSQINASISKFIYDTRCAIVHNKESEFHITTINYSEYAAIIPLIKNILQVVGESLFELINDKENGITFSKQTLELY